MSESAREFKVVEFANESVAASFCGAIMRRLQMQVVKVEDSVSPDALRLLPPFAPGATDEPGLPFAFLNAGKTLASYELASAPGRREVERLLAQSDVFIQGAPGAAGLPFEHAYLREAFPRLAVVSVTPLGLTGAAADLACDDFLAYHRSGLGHVTARTMPGFPTASLPPLRPYSRFFEMIAGLSAAIAALAMLLEQTRTGAGGAADVASVQCALPLLRRELAAYLYDGTVATRGERLWKVAPAGIQRCRDGYVFVDVIEDAQWHRLCELIGRTDLLSDERFAGREQRFENNDALSPVLDAWCATRGKQELTELGQAHGVPIAPVNEPQDVFDDIALRARHSFVSYATATHDVEMLDLPLRRGTDGVRPHGRALPEHGASRTDGPLSGFRIVELTHVWAGPLCGQLLSDLGAEVIRVESRRRIDVQRTGGPYPQKQAGINRSGVWNSQNRGKRSCTLNLATPEGRELVKQLVARSDAVIENFSPGTLDRLGLGFDVLRAQQPNVGLFSLSAFGQTGPYRDFIGYGPMMDAPSSLMAMADYGDGVPRAVNGWAGDIGGALFGALEVIAHMLSRARDGAYWADVSEYEAASLFQFEALLAWSARGESVHPDGNRWPGGGFTGCLPCREHDRWIAVAATTPAQRKALALLTQCDVEEAGDDELLRAAVRWSRERDREDTLASLVQHGIPCGLVSDVGDLANDPILQSRGAFVETPHAEVGTLRSYGPVWRFHDGERGSSRGAPCLGEDNAYVFGTLLGLDRDTIAAFEERQVIY